MKRFARFLVERRLWIFVIMMVVTVVSAVGLLYININDDMASYLSDDSEMKRGLSIMNKEFVSESETESFKLMFRGLESDEKKQEVLSKLSSYKGVGSVDYALGDPAYNKDGYTLYIVHTEYTSTKSAEALMDKINADFRKGYRAESYYPNAANNVLDIIIPIAVLIVVVVLLLACKSLFEPVVILANIAVAIVINMGTNALLPSVSGTTNSIAAVMQLILSIDYSIIFINRFRQEKAKDPDLGRAMQGAILNGFSAILASSVTTFVGLLALAFLSYKIGLDMGLVLAKGVAISLICIFTVFPSLLLWSDPIVKKTDRKKVFAGIKAALGKKKEGASHD